MGKNYRRHQIGIPEIVQSNSNKQPFTFALRRGALKILQNSHQTT